MIELIAHVTPAEWPVGILSFVAGMVSGVGVAVLVMRSRRAR